MDTVAIKIPTIGILGAGSGISVGTLTAEWVSRTTGQTKYAALGVKAGVKGGISLLAYGISKKLGVMHDTAAWFAEMFAYGCIGSVFVDIALTLYPGGFAGLAEDWAMSVRTMAAGGKKVVREMKELEKNLLPTPEGAVPAKGWF